MLCKALIVIGYLAGKQIHGKVKERDQEFENSKFNFSGSGVLFYLNYNLVLQSFMAAQTSWKRSYKISMLKQNLLLFSLKSSYFSSDSQTLLFLHREETFFSAASNRDIATGSCCHKMLFSSGPPRFTLCLNVHGTALAINRVLQTKRKRLSRMTSN